MTQPRYDDLARDLPTASKANADLGRTNVRLRIRINELVAECNHWRRVANAVDTTWRAQIEGVLNAMATERTLDD